MERLRVTDPAGREDEARRAVHGQKAEGPVEIRLDLGGQVPGARHTPATPLNAVTAAARNPSGPNVAVAVWAAAEMDSGLPLIPGK